MAPLLKARKSVGSLRRSIALRDASLTVSAGEVVCIIGPNGAGKSTALAAIAGGVTPISGAIRLDGQKHPRPAPRADCSTSLIARTRRPPYLWNAHGGGKPAARRLHARRPGRRGQRNGAPSRSFPAVARTSSLSSRPALGRRAADAGRGARRDDAASSSSGRRAVARSSGRRSSTRSTRFFSELRQREKMTLLINEQSSARILKFADRVYVLRSEFFQLEGRAVDLRDGEAIRHAYFGFGTGERSAVETAA